MMREVAHAHKRNPSSDLDKILQDGIYVDDLITKVNFGDDRLKDFRAARVKFCPFSLTLIVVRTTLRVCDTVIIIILFAQLFQYIMKHELT